MKRKHRSTPMITIAGAALLATLPFGAALAEQPAYVVSEDGYIRTGTDGCLLTQRWTPELAVRECHPEIVAQREQPEAEERPGEIAALEESQPITTTPQVVLEEIRLDSKALFDFDSATLRPEGKERLSQLVDRVDAIRNVSSVVVEGHTDPIGSEEYNEMLSRKRAESVSTYLSSTGAMPGNRIEVMAYGESSPVQTCQGVRGTALIKCLEPNRRVEVKVMGLEERMAQ